MESLTITLIEGLLEELSKTNSISVSIAGPVKDSATVAFPTFIGGLIGGRAGAVLGAMAGTGILGISKALGYGDYKPLMTALREDFTEKERNSLYERLWERLQGFVTSPLNQRMLYAALTALSETVKQNPELMENIKNELKEVLGFAILIGATSVFGCIILIVASTVLNSTIPWIFEKYFTRYIGQQPPPREDRDGKAHKVFLATVISAATRRITTTNSLTKIQYS